MIKVLTAQPVGPFSLQVTFSNGDSGIFYAAAYLAEKRGSLLEPLRSADYFDRCFIDAGALCWPNGLELSAQRVHELSTVFETS